MGILNNSYQHAVCQRSPSASRAAQRRFVPGGAADAEDDGISVAIGQPVSTVRMRLFRARQSLGKSCRQELSLRETIPATA